MTLEPKKTSANLSRKRGTFVTAMWGGSQMDSSTHRLQIRHLNSQAATLGPKHPSFVYLRAAAALLDVHDNTQFSLKYHPDLQAFVDRIVAGLPAQLPPQHQAAGQRNGVRR